MKRTVSIVTKWGSTNPPLIELRTPIRANPANGTSASESCIINDGGVLKRLNYIPNDKDPLRSKIEKLLIGNPITKGDTKLYQKDFHYFDLADPKNDPENSGADFLTPEANEHNRLIVAFLKEHQEVSVLDTKNNETNPNLNYTIYRYNFVDKTSRLDISTNTNTTIISALNTLNNWFNGEQDKLIDFAFLWGVKDIPKLTAKKLFNLLFAEINGDIEKYSRVINYIGNDVMILISKGLKTMSNNEYIIQTINGQLVYNNTPIGNSEEQAAIYFNSNPQELALLKASLGIKPNSPQLALAIEEEKVVVSPDGLKSIKLDTAAQRKFDMEQIGIKRSLANRIYRIIVMKQDVNEPKRKNQFIPLEETHKSEEIALKVLFENNEYKGLINHNEFFETEVARVRAEGTEAFFN